MSEDFDYLAERIKGAIADRDEPSLRALLSNNVNTIIAALLLHEPAEAVVNDWMAGEPMNRQDSRPDTTEQQLTQAEIQFACEQLREWGGMSDTDVAAIYDAEINALRASER